MKYVVSTCARVSLVDIASSSNGGWFICFYSCFLEKLSYLEGFFSYADSPIYRWVKKNKKEGRRYHKNGKLKKDLQFRGFRGFFQNLM